MDCTITSTARNKARRAAFSLVEAVIAGGIGTLVLAGVMSYNLFAARSMSAMGNYVTLDMNSRNAVDTMSRDIREANGCSTNAFGPTNLTLLMTDPTSGQAYTVNYNYQAASGTLQRTQTEGTATVKTLLLSNCTYFAFSYFQRNPTNGAWSAFPDDSGRADECKLVQIDWSCQKSLPGSITNSESIESARVVIRNN